MFVTFELIFTGKLRATSARKYAQPDHRKLYPTVVATSEPRRALPSLNPSDDSHERSRETGRKCGALGPLNVLTRKHYPLCTRSNARVLCLVITASKLRGPFNERRYYSAGPFCPVSASDGSDDGQAIYERVSPKPDIFPTKRIDINSREFIKVAGACEIFPDEREHERVSTDVFLGIYRALRMTCFYGFIMKFTLDINRGWVTWAVTSVTTNDDNWSQMTLFYAYFFMYKIKSTMPLLVFCPLNDDN